VTASRTDPSFASRLVLQDPALVMGLGSLEEVLGWLLESYERPATPEAVADANPNWGEEDCRIKAQALRQCPPEVVTATIEDNWPWDLIGPTTGIEVPTLVLGSDPDHGGIVPVTIGEWFAAEVPCVEYQMLAGAGHTAHREPSTYEAYLNAVLAAIGGGS
jgi:pimeloyl-ACP methyl ester carboxylesterase